MVLVVHFKLCPWQQYFIISHEKRYFVIFFKCRNNFIQIIQVATKFYFLSVYSHSIMTSRVNGCRKVHYLPFYWLVYDQKNKCLVKHQCPIIPTPSMFPQNLVHLHYTLITHHCKTLYPLFSWADCKFQEGRGYVHLVYHCIA